MRNRTLFWVLLVLAGTLAAAIGCSKKHVSQPLGNQPPETWFLDNIPRSNDTLPDRALLFWTGKDPDGRVIAYEYVIDNPAGQWTYLTADTAGTAQFIGNSLLKIGTPTQDTIQFSVPNLVGVHTLFVRAVDNLGQRDPTPASRAFTLKTIAPNTQITAGPNAGDSLFCLPAITATWKGIIFSVNPSDTMDPDGRVVGWYYAVDDSIPNPQTWRFTTNASCTLTHLADGWHTFAISAKDNADAIDPTPDKRSFEVVVPTFNQGILLVNETFSYSPPDTGKPSKAQADSFYHAVFSQTGRSWTDWDNSSGSTPPSRDILGRFSLVFWHNDEPTKKTPSIDFAKGRLQEYLSVGGKLWVVGMRNLFYLNGSSDPVNKNYAAGTFERDYLGISAANTDAATEFAGTWGQASGYPDLALDSLKVIRPWRTRLQSINVVSTFGSEPLFGFHSSPTNGNFERLPCAIRFQGPTFRTVFFTFPLYPVRIDASGEPLATVFRQTLTYLGE